MKNPARLLNSILQGHASKRLKFDFWFISKMNTLAWHLPLTCHLRWCFLA